MRNDMAPKSIDIATEVTMHPRYGKNELLLVEGRDDLLFLREKYGISSEQVLVSDGKENVINAINALASEPRSAKLAGVVDRDFSPFTCNGNHFVTDGFDVEDYFFNADDVVESVLLEIKPSLTNNELQETKTFIDEMSRKIGTLRMYSAKYSKNYVFCHNPTKYMDGTTFRTAEFSNHFKGLCNKCQEKVNRNFNASELNDATSEFGNSGYRNGHDRIEFARYYVNNCIRNPLISRPDTNVLTALFRLAYSKDEFVKTGLYSNLCSYIPIAS